MTLNLVFRPVPGKTPLHGLQTLWKSCIMNISCTVLLFFLLPGFLHSQDSAWSFSPNLMTGINTHSSLNLKEYNPLMIYDLPVVKNGFYSEFRYNYDQNNTYGLYLGKEIALDKRKEHTIVPQIGALCGSYKGVSLQCYYQLVNKYVEINFQHQYSCSVNHLPGFYFNWSDIQFPVSGNIKIGSSIQLYSDKLSKEVDAGLLISYSHAKTSVMLASFNFYESSNHFFIFCIQRDFSF